MVAGRLRSASIGCDRDCPSLAGSPRSPSAEAAGGAASPNAGGLIMPSASDAVARAAKLQSRGGSGSCDAGLQAAAAGHVEQVAPRASIDALSDELLRGWPKARACLPPPGVAGEPATSVEGRTCSDPASMVARTVSDQKGRANGGRAGAGAKLLLGNAFCEQIISRAFCKIYSKNLQSFTVKKPLLNAFCN